VSWRTGSRLFLDIWPAIKRRITDREERIEFTADLIRAFSKQDMDTYDIEDVDPDIRAAIRAAGLDICEPQRYLNDPPPP
jgi:hypothetical protein